MKVRVKFSKQGNMKFIGHLDVMRYFQKAIRRAGIDIAYTEGLSPHMIMSFASPLGVGLTSDGEYMDIELRTPVSSREAIEALNRVGAEGIEVTGFYEIPEGKANKAMTLVAAADYTVRFRRGYEPDRLLHRMQEEKGVPDPKQDSEGIAGSTSVNAKNGRATAVWTDIPSAVGAFYAQKEIPVWKKTKKFEKEVDIRPMIYEMRWVEDILPDGPDDASQAGTKLHPGNPGAVFLRLASGSVANLKPELVMNTMLGMYGIEVPPFAYEINRCELYADAGDGEARRLVPLSRLGSEIA